MMLSAAKGGRMPPPKPKSATPTASEKAAAVVSLTDFHSAASAISSEIYTTSQKLQELSRLVRDSSRSLFNDPSEKISSYVHSISEDIRRLNGKLESAQQYVQTKKEALGKNSQVADHSVMVVGELKSSLINATKSFKDVVQQRTENVKAQQERKKEFGNPSASKAAKLLRGRPKVYGKSPAGDSGGAGGAGGGGLPRPDGTLAVRETWSENGGRGRGGDGGLVKRPAKGGGLGMTQAVAPLIPDTSYFESRAEAVTEIEAHIVELGTVFNRLGELVADHQELTERLHENVRPTLRFVSFSFHFVLFLSFFLSFFLLPILS